MAEVMAEVTYVKHHKRKIVFLFSAMRHFAKSLEDDGLKVFYRQLDDPENAGSLADEVAAAIDVFGPDRIVVTAPGEYRLAKTWLAGKTVQSARYNPARYAVFMQP